MVQKVAWEAALGRGRTGCSPRTDPSAPEGESWLAGTGDSSRSRSWDSMKSSRDLSPNKTSKGNEVCSTHPLAFARKIMFL